MTPRHPDAKSYDLDHRFGEAAAIEAGTRPSVTALLRSDQWTLLKEWAVLAFRLSLRKQVTAKAMQETLFRTKPSEWATAKRILVKRNWPMILDELSAWRKLNQNI